MQNLNALLSGKYLNLYQRGLAKQEFEKILKKALKWDELDTSISKFYPEDESELDENMDLCSIGEIAASKFGYL